MDTEINMDTISYAERRVRELRAQAAEMFELPATQDTVRAAREFHLSEAIALHEAASQVQRSRLYMGERA